MQTTNIYCVESSIYIYISFIHIEYFAKSCKVASQSCSQAVTLEYYHVLYIIVLNHISITVWLQ